MRIGRIVLNILSSYFLANAFTSILGACDLRIGSVSIPPAVLLFLLLSLAIYLCWKIIGLAIGLGVIALILSLCMENRFFEKPISDLFPDVLPNVSITETTVHAPETLEELAELILPELNDFEAAIDRGTVQRKGEEGCAYIRMEYYFTRRTYSDGVTEFSEYYPSNLERFTYDDYLIQPFSVPTNRKDVAAFYAVNDEEYSVVVILMEDPVLARKDLESCLTDWYFP